MTLIRPILKSKRYSTFARKWLKSIHENGELEIHLDTSSKFLKKLGLSYLSIAEEELLFALKSTKNKDIEEYIYAFISDSSWNRHKNISVNRKQKNN